jgi:hypothetical protein
MTSFLGYRGNGYYSDDSSGLTKSFNDQYQLDVIGTSIVVQGLLLVPKMSMTNYTHGELLKAF